MSNEVQQFVAMVRQYAIKLFCPVCLADRMFLFVREDARREYYQCPECEAIVSYDVR